MFNATGFPKLPSGVFYCVLKLATQKFGFKTNLWVHDKVFVVNNSDPSAFIEALSIISYFVNLLQVGQKMLHIYDWFVLCQFQSLQGNQKIDQI